MPHTFIDVGWWMQLYLPLPVRSQAPQLMKEMGWSMYADGAGCSLVTNREHIGTYVARILADPRTLNHAVMVWEDEVRQSDAHALGELLSGEGDALREKRIAVSVMIYLCTIAMGGALTYLRIVEDERGLRRCRGGGEGSARTGLGREFRGTCI